MKDRIPADPGRVLITPEDGSAAFYATMSRADNPTQEGDPLNKNTLLKDTTAALFGLGSDAVPDDIFSILSKAAVVGETDGELNTVGGQRAGLRIATGSYIGSGVYGSNNPNILTFEFVPKIVIVQGTGRPNVMISPGGTLSTWATTYASGGVIQITFDGNSVSWYIIKRWSGTTTGSVTDDIGSKGQLNEAEKTYTYLAIG